MFKQKRIEKFANALKCETMPRERHYLRLCNIMSPLGLLCETTGLGRWYWEYNDYYNNPVFSYRTEHETSAVDYPPLFVLDWYGATDNFIRGLYLMGRAAGRYHYDNDEIASEVLFYAKNRGFRMSLEGMTDD